MTIIVNFATDSPCGILLRFWK